jgi:hypothetical protein
MTTFGSTTEDADGVPIGKGDVDRGPPEEMRMTEAELRGEMQTIATAKKSMGELATIQGVMAEMKMQQSMMDNVLEQHNKLLGMYATLRGELETFKQQWNIERQSWLAKGGSTTPEDKM